MKTSFALRSAVIFGLFSLLGPVMRSISGPTFLALHREELSSLFWPALVLSAGGHPNSSQDFWMSLIVNVFGFALIGLIVATVGKSFKVAAVVFVCICTWLTLVEAWGSGFNLAYFSWSVLLMAFFLYAVPFWAVVRIGPRKSADAARSQHAPDALGK